METLKLETTKLAGKNFLQQQAKFNDFIECYNNERPHQPLNMRTPAECYLPSTRPYIGLPELDYPFHDKSVTVTNVGASASIVQSTENQSQQRVRWPEGGHQAGERGNLARLVHGL